MRLPFHSYFGRSRHSSKPHCSIDATEGVTLVGGAILSHYGVLKISNLFESALIEGIRRTAERLYRERDRRIAAGECPPSGQEQSYLRRTLPIESIIVDGKPATARLLCQAFDDLAGPYLEKTPSLEPNSYVRELIPGPHSKALPFHQDQTILKTRLLNIWIPLVKCGVTAPGLEAVVAPGGELLAIAGRPDHDIPAERARIDENLVLKTFGRDALWHPSFNPGDAFVFAGTTVHRTHVTPRMTKPRLSIELRLV